MSATRESSFETHNRQQARYFDAGLKQTMVPSGSPYINRQCDELLASANLRPPAHILDVGCGMGRYTIPLAERGFQIEGIDLSRYLLDRLTEFAADRVEIPVHHEDVVRLAERRPEAFDAVVGFFALHHVHDVSASIEAAAALTKPGGSVAFLEPNPNNPLYYLQVAFTPGMRWKSEKGLVRMRPRIVGEAMRRAGLDDVQVKRFGFFPPVIANKNVGARVERLLEKPRLWRGLLPFQIFVGGKRSSGDVNR